MHIATHVPVEQTSPLAQGIAHPPQFAGSACVSVQVPEHRVCPAVGQSGTIASLPPASRPASRAASIAPPSAGPVSPPPGPGSSLHPDARGTARTRMSPMA